MAQLTCPGCGAAAQPDASRCDYCTSALVKIACPSCLGGLFEGMRFCPHCGTRATRAPGDETSTIRCPGCKGAMTPARVGAIALHECHECVSCWLSAETFVELCTGRELRGAVAAAVAARVEGPNKRGAAGVRYRPCPLCGKLMNRSNFAKRSGIVIDVCKGHGVWFEHQELRGVLEFIERGGLERARAMDHEREAAELRALRSQLRDRPRDRGTDGGASEPTSDALDVIWSLLD
jgi:Zn-finger nucleic acid-binding protein